MARRITLGAAQLGPIAKDESKAQVVERMITLLRIAAHNAVDLLVFPELALTTFFPRWYIEDLSESDHYYHSKMPDADTQPLFDEAKSLGVGFALGYAELAVDDAGTVHRYNTYLLVDREGKQVGKFHKVHIPGHAENEPWRVFQHLERHYFEPGPEGFGVWEAFDSRIGMALCNDRRWSETYRVMGLQGAEVILIGYNTPLHYSPDPTQNALAGFHNHLVMQSGAYQNGSFVVGVAKGGIEEGVDSLAQSVIIAPSGQIIAQAITTGDEVISANVDLDFCATYKGLLFDFNRYRMPEHYGSLTVKPGAKTPPPES
ncbi:MAG: N-carbamoyl-D-amino-acid hydrolase [bacterium]|nr:N-carbamoyl-D-amino-acid hydrolase [bacterium]